MVLLSSKKTREKDTILFWKNFDKSLDFSAFYVYIYIKTSAIPRIFGGLKKMQTLFEKIGPAIYRDRQANVYTVAPDVKRRDINILSIELGSGSLDVSDLADVCTVAKAVVLRETLAGSRSVSLSGRLPAWAAAAIHHALKPYCDTLYQYDPKMGHVAVMQHRGHVAVGAVVS